MMMNSIIDDEVAQKKGVVHIVYHPKDAFSMLVAVSSKWLDNLRKGGEMLASLPLRVSSMHQCFQNPDGPKLKLLSAMSTVIGKEARLRMKIHFGKGLLLLIEWCAAFS
jgi:hypothetical protein